MATSNSEDDPDADGSEDAEYDLDTPPSAPADTHQDGRSSSEDSVPSRKRKASPEDDDYIKQNPELYGLRRSGRSRASRRVVDSSSEEGSESDDVVHRRKKRRTTASTKRSQQTTPALPSTAESDSGSDDFQTSKKNALTKAQRRRRLQVAAGLVASTPVERFSERRRAAKVTTYNEDDEDPFEEDEDDVTPAYWAADGAEDAGPEVAAVWNYRVKEGHTLNPAEPSKHDFEFMVKWKDRAYSKSEWRTISELAGYRGTRKVENYFKGVILDDLYMNHDPEVAPEDRETWNLKREATVDAVLEYTHVDRVISTQESDEGTEYLVKWKGLGYEESTWEPASLVSELAQNEIDRFLDRSSKLPVSDKSQSNLKTRRKHELIKTQPDYIKHGELRDFQITGLNFLAFNWARGRSVILADEMGLGKTVQTVAFMNYLRHARGQQGPFLVVVPLSTMPAWQETMQDWTPDLNYVAYAGNETGRKIIQEHELFVDANPKKVKFHVLLTTYEMILLDWPILSQINWQLLAVDEAHRLKNRESQFYLRLSDFTAPSKLLITGTPMQNNISELASLMDFLGNPDIQIDYDIDLQSEDASKKIKDLTNAIDPYMLRRTKQTVENDLPPKTEKIIRVELADVQLEYYRNILTRNYEALNAGANGPKQSLLNIMMELKKASNHPFMFPNAEEKICAGNTSREDTLRALVTSSGKMMLLRQLLERLHHEGHRVLIFSQMVKMLDIISDYLTLDRKAFQRLDGNIASAARRKAIDHFNAPGSEDFCFLLSTRAGGLGINLMTADTVILFDSDWNPQADLQAMARAHRIGQKNPVTVYRFVSRNTVEEEILERARNKLMLEYITIQRGITDKESQELQTKLNASGRNVSAPDSSEDISQILKRRGQKMFEQSSNQQMLEGLNIDDVLANAEEHKTEQPEGITAEGGEDFLKSFEYTDVKVDITWDDIIPKDTLEAIKSEVQKKKEDEFLEQVREQNRPRKRKAPASDEREQRLAKKRAREAAAEAAATSDQSDNEAAGLDPSRPLNEKEVRGLYHEFTRWGALDDWKDEAYKEAGLASRDRTVVKATMDEIIALCKEKISESQKELESKEKEASKSLTKKDKKAIIVSFRGHKRINADIVMERPEEMRLVKETTESVHDWRNFRVAGADKPTNYTCDWGAREDGMLCVGMARHGYGAWTEIRDDVELGLKEKFFLEEHRVEKKEQRKNAEQNAKSPGAVHLVRRANYLLSVLKAKQSDNAAAKKKLENHHRNNKKWAAARGHRELTETGSASPNPSLQRKVHRDVEKARHRAHSSTDHRHSVERHSSRPERQGTPDQRRKANGEVEKHKKVESRPSSQTPHTTSNHATTSNGHGPTSKYDKIFEPIQNELEMVKGHAKLADKKQRLIALKDGLFAIGHFIDKNMAVNGEVINAWDVVAQKWWPRRDVNGAQLLGMFHKISKKEQEGKAKASGAPAATPVNT